MSEGYTQPRRSRVRIALAAALVIVCGLLSGADIPLPSLAATYSGDVLYATLIALLAALVWPRAPFWRLGLLALGFCSAVELSQLIEAPWLDALRGTLPGRLVLGAGFLWSDLACYRAGVLVGALIDLVLASPWRR